MKNCHFVILIKHITHHNTNMPWYKNFKHPQTQVYSFRSWSKVLWTQRESIHWLLHSYSILLKVALDCPEIELNFYTQLTPKAWESLSLGMKTPILFIEMIPCSQKMLAIPDTVFPLSQRKGYWEEFQRTV